MPKAFKFLVVRDLRSRTIKRKRGSVAFGVLAVAAIDSYTRALTILSTGWLDRNGNGALDDDEPRRTIRAMVQFTLSRAGVFDYAYFVNNYVDTKQTYQDGTANPYYGQGAYLDVWNSSTSSYERLTTNGVVTGNAKVIGDSSHPIKIHGPVTITQDAVVKGYVQGQGTVYTGRNVHIVGSINYKEPPDFRGTDPQAIDNANEKKTLLGLAARASIIMGDTSQFGDNPLNYMTPPFTHARYDDNGNYVPAYDARQVDSYGAKKYQSVLGDSYVHSVSANVGQVDAVLYTNFLGGGNIGTGGGGVTFNGSIISRDEAMVLFSLPFRMNYDNRIKERSLDGKPLVDIDLPRTPGVSQVSWQEVCQ